MARTSELYDLLMSDWLNWEWQPLEPVLLKLANRVPPGKALRTYQRVLLSMEKRGRAIPEDLSMDTQIDRGKRIIANGAIQSAMTNGRAERTTLDGVAMIRRVERRVSHTAVVPVKDREVLIDRLREAMTDPDWLGWIVDSLADIDEQRHTEAHPYGNHESDS